MEESNREEVNSRSLRGKKSNGMRQKEKRCKF
jgi:hypothetical protein